MTTKVTNGERTPTSEEFDRYDNNLILTQFILGIPMLIGFFIFELPWLQTIDLNIAFFLGGFSVLGIMILPVKLSYRLVTPEWITKGNSG